MTFPLFYGKILGVLWGDIMISRKGNLRIKILSVATAISMLAAGFKIVYTKQKKAELEEENARLKQEFQDMLDEELRVAHENMNNDKDYRVTDEVEVGGRTIKFVEEITPSPTPTPTVTIEDLGYIDRDSRDYIMIEDGVYHEPEKVLDLDFDTVDEMIDFYCKVFQVEETTVGNKIYELIAEDRTGWEQNNKLDGTEYETKEQAIARNIAYIALFPEYYDLGDISVDEYELDMYKPEEFIDKFCGVIGVNKDVAEAIAYSESGTKLDSYNFQTRYNVGGLRRRAGDPHPATSWGLAIYKNPAEGLYRFVCILHDNFYVDRDSGAERIKAMSYSYCEDSAYWRGLVLSVYGTIINNGYDYYYNLYRYDRDLIHPESPLEKTIQK